MNSRLDGLRVAKPADAGWVSTSKRAQGQTDRLAPSGSESAQADFAAERHPGAA